MVEASRLLVESLRKSAARFTCAVSRCFRRSVAHHFCCLIVTTGPVPFASVRIERKQREQIRLDG